MSYQYRDTMVEADEEGYLTDVDQWDRELAVLIAASESVEMTEEHWQVILFLRRYYEEFLIAPPNRVVIKAIKTSLGSDKGTSQYLYTLFPEGLARQAGKIAGLPKPSSCI